MKLFNPYLLLFFWMIVSFTSFGKSIRVKAGGSIPNAVEQANAGDTVIVSKGDYTVNELIIRKSITLIGEGMPTLDGQDKGNIILIAGKNITVNGFRFINTGRSNTDDSAAIKFFDSSYCTIEGNELLDTFFGLHFSNSSHLTIRNNRLISTADREFETGNGIHLWKCKENLIENNYVKGHRDGIYLEFTTDTEVINNTIENNMRYGLHFMFAHDNSYIKNRFKANGAGVAVMYTKNVLMKENIFEQSEGSSSYGILLKDISDSQIIGNKFQDNTIGIYMEGCSRSEFTGNLFTQNGWALKLMASCDQNTFENNNFINNTFDISTNGSVVLNELIGNYWDKYEGYDLNKDRIGDVPYRPISLFSVIVEKIPTAVILWRSFMVTLLDRMEKVMPSITPENMIDNSPKMKPNDLNTTHP